MSLLIDTEVPCPRCGSQVDLSIEPGIGTQRFVEDCPVCCQPLELTARFVDGVLVEIEGRREDG